MGTKNKHVKKSNKQVIGLKVKACKCPDLLRSPLTVFSYRISPRCDWTGTRNLARNQMG